MLNFITKKINPLRRSYSKNHIIRSMIFEHNILAGKIKHIEYINHQIYIIPGIVFTDIFKNNTFIKITNQSECHRDLQYHTGLNVDPKPLDLNIFNGAGMSFIDSNDLHFWLELLHLKYPSGFIRQVSIVPDSRICMIDGESRLEFKTDKFILSRVENLHTARSNE